MPTFTFKLDPLLQQKRIVEDRSQRELAGLIHRRVTIQQRLQGAQTDVSGSKRNLAASLLGQVDMTAVREHAQFSMEATNQGYNVVRELAGLEQQINTARQQMLHARRERMAIETLRERKHTEWKREQRRREDARLDEAATQVFIRRQQTEQAGRAGVAA